MTPRQALETVGIVCRQFKGSFEEHQHIDECLTVLIKLLKAHGLDKEEQEIQQELS
jgi:hypothetical protein